jgi:hypothetical protein
VGFIDVTVIMQSIMVKILIRRKEFKIQPESTAISLTSVQTFIKPDQPPAKENKKE